jgi:hypothetical protein
MRLGARLAAGGAVAVLILELAVQLVKQILLLLLLLLLERVAVVLRPRHRRVGGVVGCRRRIFRVVGCRARVLALSARFAFLRTRHARGRAHRGRGSALLV